MNITEKTTPSESVHESTVLESPKVPFASTWEDLCVLLYTYRFVAIGFLDLVARYKEALDIKPPDADCQKSLGKEE